MKLSKTLLAISASLALTASASSYAAETDIGALNCAQFVASLQTEAGNYLVAWALGYADSKAGTTIIAKDVAGQLATYCATNGDANLVKATMEAASKAQVTAEDPDMAKLTCGEFLKDQSGIASTISWIDGYLSAESDNTVMDDEWMKKLGTNIATYCQANQDKSIVDAMNALPPAEE